MASHCAPVHGFAGAVVFLDGVVTQVKRGALFYGWPRAQAKAIEVGTGGTACMPPAAVFLSPSFFFFLIFFGRAEFWLGAVVAHRYFVIPGG